MFTLRTTLVTAAIAALAAFPAAALTIDDAVSVQLDALTPAETTAAADIAVATDDAAMKALPLEQQAFASNTVVSADGAVIGMVQRVQRDFSGNIELMVSVDNSIGSTVKAFSVQLAPDAKADGAIRLGWNKADLITTLDAQVQG